MRFRRTSTHPHRPGALSLWLIPPALGWRRKTGGLRGNELSRPLLAVAVILAVVAALTGIPLYRSHDAAGLAVFGLQIPLLLFALLLVIRLFLRLHRQLLAPLAHLRNWALRVRGGNLSARIPVPAQGEFVSLAHDMNSLADQLQTLAEDMSAQVRNQTARISRKTRSLEILYEVVASLNTSRNRDELLAYFLETLSELLDARAASVSLLGANGALHTVATHDDIVQILAALQIEDIGRALARSAAVTGKLKLHKVTRPGDLGTTTAGEGNAPELIAVPIQYRDRIQGVFTLCLARPSAELGDDFRDLLTSVGRHVGLALEKARLDEDARRLAVMEERDMLRNELHDSLAQSLVSMRLQVKMLGETLHKKDMRTAQSEVRQLHLALEEAHISLRELLASFRSRMDKRGLAPALEDLVERFQQDTGIATYFQQECREINLSPTQEVQVFRIVQEALANIRKHSRARTARVLLSGTDDGGYRVLIEDDGVGINEIPAGDKRGEHIGLAIMRERTHQLPGTLTVESEPGEGTRVCLIFPVKRAANLSAASR